MTADAIVVGIMFVVMATPVVVMCLLGRGWLALSYLAIQTALIGLMILFDPTTIFGLRPLVFFNYINLAIGVTGSVHAALLGPRKDWAAWYSRLWLVLPAGLVLLLALNGTANWLRGGTWRRAMEDGSTIYVYSVPPDDWRKFHEYFGDPD